MVRRRQCPEVAKAGFAGSLPARRSRKTLIEKLPRKVARSREGAFTKWRDFPKNRDRVRSREARRGNGE